MPPAAAFSGLSELMMACIHDHPRRLGIRDKTRTRTESPRTTTSHHQRNPHASCEALDWTLFQAHSFPMPIDTLPCHTVRPTPPHLFPSCWARSSIAALLCSLSPRMGPPNHLYSQPSATYFKAPRYKETHQQSMPPQSLVQYLPAPTLRQHPLTSSRDHAKPAGGSSYCCKRRGPGRTMAQEVARLPTRIDLESEHTHRRQCLRTFPMQPLTRGRPRQSKSLENGTRVKKVITEQMSSSSMLSNSPSVASRMISPGRTGKDVFTASRGVSKLAFPLCRRHAAQDTNKKKRRAMHGVTAFGRHLSTRDTPHLHRVNSATKTPTNRPIPSDRRKAHPYAPVSEAIKHSWGCSSPRTLPSGGYESRNGKSA